MSNRVNRVEYQEKLKSLHEEIILMGAEVEKQIHYATTALLEQDSTLARKVIAGDDEIDNAERQIHHSCVLLIARQQPVASDLRDLTANMRLISDLERVADHAEDISRDVLIMNDEGWTLTIPHDIVCLAELCQRILHGALNSYVSRDLALAEQTIMMKARIGDLYNKIKNYLIHQMELDPKAAPGLANMLLIAKNLERASAHAQNIAEWVVYYVSGEYVKEVRILEEEI